MVAVELLHTAHPPAPTSRLVLPGAVALDLDESPTCDRRDGDAW